MCRQRAEHPLSACIFYEVADRGPLPAPAGTDLMTPFAHPGQRRHIGQQEEQRSPFSAHRGFETSNFFKTSEENKMENTKTTYTYHFADGDQEIELSQYWKDILEDMDREEYNNDHRQFRDGRRCPIEFGEMEDKMIGDGSDQESCGLDGIHLEQLKKDLSKRQGEVLDELLRNGGFVKETAEAMHLSVAAIRTHKEMIAKKLYGDFHKEPVIDNRKTGRNIRDLRIAAGMTGYMAAEIAGIHYRKYYRIEDGTASAPEEAVQKLAIFFAVSAEEILAYKN